MNAHRMLVATAIALAGCAGMSQQDLAEDSRGRITKIVPVVIQSDKAPGIGSALTPPTANRRGQRITVVTGNDKIMEVTQDETPSLKVGDTVRIEGYGANAKLRPVD
ncbi:MAG TPA: hypothetical protein VFV90_11020 [Usitatibacter sp.]|nr:hypothetical protein [Usitatibacter sp.]